MVRHRRRTTTREKHNLNIWDDSSDVKNMFKGYHWHKELKTELKHLQLECKLNQQIKRLI